MTQPETSHTNIAEVMKLIEEKKRLDKAELRVSKARFWTKGAFIFFIGGFIIPYLWPVAALCLLISAIVVHT